MSFSSNSLFFYTDLKMGFHHSISLTFTEDFFLSKVGAVVGICNPAHGEVYSIQHYVINFVIDLQQVSGFLLTKFVVICDTDIP